VAEVSPLLQAVYSGDHVRVESLLVEAPELDIFEASALGRTERVAELLGNDPKLVRAWSPDGFTALHLAAFFSRPETALLLLERGAEVDPVARNPMRVTPLHSAAAARNTETARDLLERGADPNARQQGGFTPVHAAAQNADDELYELLIAHGADAELRADNGRTARDFADREP
jgi:ankyrin repeat protein